MTLARRAFSLLDPVVGRLALIAQRQRNAGVVVLYHRVAPGRNAIYPPLHPAEFELHCALLKDYFDVVRLSELVERRRAGDSLNRYCAITFDDGYADFRDYALPIAEAHCLPVTQFPITECLETGKPPWDLRLQRVLLCSPWSDLADEGLFARLNRISVAERDEWLAGYEREIEPSGELHELPKMLRSSDLDGLRARGVEIGSHTMSHRRLADVDRLTAQEELAGSRARLGEMLGGQPSFVAYPLGSRTAEVGRLARDAGYDAGLVAGSRRFDHRCDPFAIPRFDVTDRPANMLRLELGGVVPMMRRIRSRVLRGA
jgi:peptidoglycan/xylan/chitin deacetylase (PgdA/CDA1 family)